MGENRDHDCDRVNGGGDGRSQAQVSLKGDRGGRLNRGEIHGLHGEILIFVRASLLARLEPVLLGHHVPGRLSWQHVEVDVEAWMGAPCWQPGVEFLAVTRTLNRRTLAEPRPGSTSVTRPAISDRAVQHGRELRGTIELSLTRCR